MTQPESEHALLGQYLTRLDGRAWGFALGLIAGIGLFCATNILVLKGGDDMGQHLALLSQFFPGYSVSFLGSIIGFVYALFCGYITGRVICAFYNFAARRA